MAPHVIDSAASHAPNMSNSKSVSGPQRIRPAIPLVFGRSKNISKSAINGSNLEKRPEKINGDAKPNVSGQNGGHHQLQVTTKAENPSASLRPIETPTSPKFDKATKVQPSSNGKVGNGNTSPTDSASERNNENDESKHSSSNSVSDTPSSSTVPFSPNRTAMNAPSTMPSQSMHSAHHSYPSEHDFNHNTPQNGHGDYPNYYDASSHSHQDVGPPRPRADAAAYHSHHERQYSNVSGHTLYPPPGFPEPINTMPILPPPGLVNFSPNGGPLLSPSITSPTAWNPAANFVMPPGLNNGPQPPVNGYHLSRSGSNSSSAQDIQPFLPAFVPPTAAFLPPLPTDSQAIAHFLSGQFLNREFADVSVVVQVKGSERPGPAYPFHRVVVARSPTMASLLRNRSPESASKDGLKLLTLEISGKFAQPHAVLDALAYLYGQPLPSFDANLGPSSSVPEITAAFTASLQLTAAAQYLKLPDLMLYAITYASNNLTWYTISKAYSFVREGLNSLPQNDESELNRNMSIPYTDLYRNIEKFIIDFFPDNFEFHASSPELSECGRLPIPLESRPSVSDPRRAEIQFGAMPTEQSSHLEFVGLLSSILLSFPTSFLQNLLESSILGEKLGWSRLGQLVSEVVAERERRRLKVLKTKRVMPGASAQQWEETKWEEHMETFQRSPSGYILLRTYKAAQTKE